jgi:hypothetical protein
MIAQTGASTAPAAIIAHQEKRLTPRRNPDSALSASRIAIELIHAPPIPTSTRIGTILALMMAPVLARCFRFAKTVGCCKRDTPIHPKKLLVL